MPAVDDRFGKIGLVPDAAIRTIASSARPRRPRGSFRRGAAVVAGVGT